MIYIYIQIHTLTTNNVNSLSSTLSFRYGLWAHQSVARCAAALVKACRRPSSSSIWCMMLVKSLRCPKKTLYHNIQSYNKTYYIYIYRPWVILHNTSQPDALGRRTIAAERSLEVQTGQPKGLRGLHGPWPQQSCGQMAHDLWDLNMSELSEPEAIKAKTFQVLTLQFCHLD